MLWDGLQNVGCFSTIEEVNAGTRTANLVAWDVKIASNCMNQFLMFRSLKAGYTINDAVMSVVSLLVVILSSCVNSCWGHH